MRYVPPMPTAPRPAESAELLLGSWSTTGRDVAFRRPTPELSPRGTERPARIAESTVSVHVVRGLLELVEQAGFPRAEFLREAGMDLDVLDVPVTRVSRAVMARLLSRAMERLDDPALGLHWAEATTERMFVPLSHLIAHSATLRHGLELNAQFFPLLSDHPAYEVFELSDQVVLRCQALEDDPPDIRRLAGEMMVAGFFRLVRTFDPSGPPGEASFEHAAPGHRSEYERIFEGRVRFEQPFTGLVFDRASLDAVSPQKDDDIREALEALAERRLLQLAERTPYALRVREHLVREGWRDRADMKSVARSLELSVRSLRRRLADEGKTFDDVANDAFATVARRLLDDPRRTIQETAFEMGFSDASTFHRAFKRWTGTTPSAYRSTKTGAARG